MAKKEAHVAQWKKDAVKVVAKAMQSSPIIGVLNMEGLPAAQLGQMKSKLRGSVDILMTRRLLINRALKEVQKPGIEKLQEYIDKGMPALLFTKENPFALFKTLKKSKSRAAAKPGQTAPYDIVIPAGPTPFTPGPVISEFAQIGVKAGVEGGKVAVKQDAVVAKAGEPIKGPVASMLARLGIEPMEIGLNLVAVYENGTVYKANILDIDEEAFMNKLVGAATEALNLAVEAAYPTADTTELLVQKAWREAKTVAIDGNILARGLQEEVLASAERIAASIKDELKL